jgi:hypothetical protein
MGRFEEFGKHIDEEVARLKRMNNFEDFGKRVDEELARMKTFVKEEVAPETEKRTAQFLREISEKLSEAAGWIEARNAARNAQNPPKPQNPRTSWHERAIEAFIGTVSPGEGFNRDGFLLPVHLPEFAGLLQTSATVFRHPDRAGNDFLGMRGTQADCGPAAAASCWAFEHPSGKGGIREALDRRSRDSRKSTGNFTDAESWQAWGCAGGFRVHGRGERVVVRGTLSWAARFERRDLWHV